ncbi:helix-turn-helix domain-containing protein [Klebsiella sp. Ap-873]|nr:helix-turn-helix domain-containing protein [Klebsiella sp. Ap-873]
MSGLHKAIAKAGNQYKLACLLGIKPQSLNRWIKRYNGIVPSDRVFPIFNATGVTPHELRPDLYPNPTDGLPADQNNNTPSV